MNAYTQNILWLWISMLLENFILIRRRGTIIVDKHRGVVGNGYARVAISIAGRPYLVARLR